MKKREHFNLPLLQQRAQVLKGMLEQLSAQEPLAASCLKGLNPMFEEILSGQMTTPYKEVPYGHYFHFDDLRKYKELEEVYSSFAITATGFDDETVRKMMASIGAQSRT